MAVVQIPVKPGIAQIMKVTLLGVDYILKFRWNQYFGAWVMDISDVNNVLIIGGLMLVAGTDILEQYEYLPIAVGGGFLLLSNEPGFQPTFNGFGVYSLLYYVTR